MKLSLELLRMMKSTLLAAVQQKYSELWAAVVVSEW